MSVSGLPHGGAEIWLTYTSEQGRRETLWPRLASGYYGGYVIHEDLIVFEADWPPHDLWDADPAILAAKGGPPAVDITKIILRAANADASDKFAVDLRGCDFKRGDSGLRINFRRWLVQEKRYEPQMLILTWHELEQMVTQLRTTGTPCEFKGTRYYAEK